MQKELSARRISEPQSEKKKDIARVEMLIAGKTTAKLTLKAFIGIQLMKYSQTEDTVSSRWYLIKAIRELS